jgi:hypothetical protein
MKRAMLEAYTAGIAYDGIRYSTPKMRREIYEALRLKVTVSKEGTLRIQGIADAQVIKLTHGVEDYGQEVERYRQKLTLSNRTATSMAEVAG